MPNKLTTGVLAALSSAFFLGLAPVFGKLAILLGFSPLATVALRTGIAAGALLLIYLFFYRPFFYIFPIGLIGCILAGVMNGIGSILYYLALAKLDVTIGQLLYSLYPFFVAFWLMLDHQPPSNLTLFRIVLAIGAVLLLTRIPLAMVDPGGILMMIAAASLYALHLPINQRVLYEVPAPTVTLYTLLSMSAVVIPVYTLFDHQWPVSNTPWFPIIALSLVTFISRLLLFSGVKKIGGMQTALLGLTELLITIIFGYLWLHERLTAAQWMGAFILATSLLLIYFEKAPTHHSISGKTGWLSWIRPPDLNKEYFGPYE